MTPPEEIGQGILLHIAQEEDFVENVGATCSICLSEFRPGEELAKIDCSHVFHVQCLNRWLANVCSSGPNLSALQEMRGQDSRDRPKVPRRPPLRPPQPTSASTRPTQPPSPTTSHQPQRRPHIRWSNDQDPQKGHRKSPEDRRYHHKATTTSPLTATLPLISSGFSSVARKDFLRLTRWST